MSESYPNAVKCVTCGVMTPRYNINHLGRCSNCQRRVDDDEDSSRRSYNMAMGDMLNTGIPGGIDMDITTPL